MLNASWMNPASETAPVVAAVAGCAQTSWSWCRRQLDLWSSSYSVLCTDPSWCPLSQRCTSTKLVLKCRCVLYLSPLQQHVPLVDTETDTPHRATPWHITWYTSTYPWSRSVVLVLGWMDWLEHRLTGSGSASEACSRRAIQIHCYSTLLYTTYHSHRGENNWSPDWLSCMSIIRLMG